MSGNRGWHVGVHVLGLRLTFTVRPWRGLVGAARSLVVFVDDVDRRFLGGRGTPVDSNLATE